MQFAQKLEQLEKRFDELTQQMADPAVISDADQYRKVTKAQAEFSEIVGKYREWKDTEDSLSQARAMLQEKDPELRVMAEEEVAQLEPQLARIEEEIKILLLPKDPNDDKNVVLEIRAGTGGDEATLFAAEIFRMYSRFAEGQRWKMEVTATSESAVGGLKEVIALVSGDKVYSKLKYESGVHRVQRVPVTEQQGRVHTSAITVAILPEADEVEVKIDAKDIRIDTLLFLRARRSIGQHHVFRRAHYPLAYRPGGFLPGREIADQEPRQGGARAALAPLRTGTGKAAGGSGGRTAQHGGFRRPQREDPHLQFPAKPGHRPSHQFHHPSAGFRDGWQARPDPRSAHHVLPQPTGRRQ